MISKSFLEDGAVFQGKNLDELLKISAKFEKRTKEEIVLPYRLSIFSVIQRRMEGDRGIFVIRISPDDCTTNLLIPETEDDIVFSSKNKKRGLLPFETLKSWNMSEKIIDEIYERGFFLQYHDADGNKKVLIPSKGFLSTFSRQIGCGKLSEGINPIRDVYIGSLLRGASSFKLIYRMGKHFGKAFGCFSDSFCLSPNEIITDVKNGIETLLNEKLIVVKWRVTHSITTVDFAIAKPFHVNGFSLQKGIRFSYSDIGDASYTLEELLYVEKGVICRGKVATKNHSYAFNIDEFLQGYEPQKNIMQIMLKARKTSISSIRKEVEKMLKSIKFYAELGVTKEAEFQRVCIENLPETEGTKEDALLYLLSIPTIIAEMSSSDSWMEKISNKLADILV